MIKNKKINTKNILKVKDRENAKTLTPKRIDKVIKNLPKNDFNYYKSAVQAGYAHSTAVATTNLKTTIAKRLKELEECGQLPQNKVWDIPELIEEYHYIATQRKDLSTKHKAIDRILSQYPDILPKQEEEQQKMPPLIIGIKEVNVIQQPKDTIEQENAAQ